MNRTFRSLLTGLAVTALMSVSSPLHVAAQDASPIAAYRQSLMQAIRTHMGGVRAVAGGTAPAGHAELHAVALQNMAQAAANAFPEGSAGPGSRALPAIWENRSDFMNKVSALQSASATLVTAARSGDSERIQSALQGVQGTCGACHQPYRAR